ncbi:MAG TPA: NAD(P)/FAD-dependent oxidoreductase [Kofleriaceae bacterium]|nr:NAD(P)/FAD-dependent oxidoreductase [Kofleriaceae bacterium]
MTAYDVVVVGSGPNGLAAALAFSELGLHTLVVEARDTPGGGMRTSALTAPGYLHDVCSTVHPLGLASPWLRALALEDHGLEWIHPTAPVAHVVGPGEVVTLERSIADTAAQLGPDGDAYRALVEPFVEKFDELLRAILGPLRIPRHPLVMAQFGLRALRSMRGLGRTFRTRAAPALLAGIAAHSMVPLDGLATSSFGLVLATAGHAVGWPIARGGSQAICDAMVARFRAQGGELVTRTYVERLEQLPRARAYVLDVTPKQLLAIAGERLSAGYRRGLEQFRYGLGVFKMDWALSGPVPWRDPRCARSATVHLSGTLDDIAAAEDAAHAGKIAERPFLLFVQPTLFDPSRAPAGGHVAWAYCHVPNGSTIDVTRAIEDHLELHAPGFRDLVIARRAMNSAQMESYNPNYVGGDINGGISDLAQLFFRPMPRFDPYATPLPDVFVCSSSTPPGGGVHGMCGYYAARSVLARVFGKQPPDLA